MKKLMIIGVAALASVAMAQEKTISLADASAKIAEAAESSDAMASIMKQLSAADQVAFLSKVNAAIAKQPGSQDEAAAKYLAANSAALKNAKKDNVPALLAETYATVPPEALTVINERFASDLFNRAADPSKPVSDEQFTKIATDTMKTIQDRNASADNAGVRDTFAILMFLRASNGTPADLSEKLVANLPDEKTQEYAKNEWIPPAMSADKNYEPMLGASDAGEAPDAARVLELASDMTTTALLSDLSSKDNEFAGALFTQGLTGVASFGTSSLDRVPRTMNKDNKWYADNKRGDSAGGEPGPYSGQRTY